MNEPVTTPLTWRQLALVVLLAGVGVVVLLQFIYLLIIIPLRPSQIITGLIGVTVLYLANFPFGFLVGYLWPRRGLGDYVFLGLAVGLAEWLGATVWFVAYSLPPSPVFWLEIYGLAPAIIFSSLAIIGGLVKKGQLSFNAAAVASAIGLVTAIVGLVSAIVSFAS